MCRLGMGLGYCKSCSLGEVVIYICQMILGVCLGYVYFNSILSFIHVSLNVKDKINFINFILSFFNVLTKTTSLIITNMITSIKYKLKTTNVVYHFCCPVQVCLSCHKPIIYIGCTSTTIARKMTNHLSDFSVVKNAPRHTKTFALSC